MAVHGKDGLVRVRNAFDQVADQIAELVRYVVTDRIGDIDRVAPSLITASITRHRKSGSERPASSGENSTSSVYWRACLTAATAASTTWSGVMRSLCSM